MTESFIIIVKLKSEINFAQHISEISVTDISGLFFETINQINEFIQMYYDTIIVECNAISYFIDMAIFNTISINDKLKLFKRNCITEIDLSSVIYNRILKNANYSEKVLIAELNLNGASIIELHTNFGVIVVNKYSNIQELRKNIRGLFIDNMWYNGKQLDENIPLYLTFDNNDLYVYKDIVINKRTV